MEEVFKRLESVDVQQSSRAISRLQKRLSSTRDPQLLGELIEHYLTTGSKQTLNVLLGLKDVQSQVRRDTLRNEVCGKVSRFGRWTLIGRTDEIGADSRHC